MQAPTRHTHTHDHTHHTLTFSHTAGKGSEGSTGKLSPHPECPQTTDNIHAEGGVKCPGKVDLVHSLQLVQAYCITVLSDFRDPLQIALVSSHLVELSCPREQSVRHQIECKPLGWLLFLCPQGVVLTMVPEITVPLPLRLLPPPCLLMHPPIELYHSDLTLGIAPDSCPATSTPKH